MRARLFAANGTPLGADFAVNLFVPGEQLFPAVAGEIDGFIVVWQSDDDAGPTDDLNIAARVYDSTGAPLTGELLVNEGTEGAQEVPAIRRENSGKLRPIIDLSGIAGAGRDRLMRDLHLADMPGIAS